MRSLDAPDPDNFLYELEWAFAGKSHTRPLSPSQNGTERASHSVWEHWIDSRSDDPSADEGDLWPQPNGDVLEIGRMIRPSTGLLTDYEELWTDLPIGTVGEETHCVSIVLRVKESTPNGRGMIIRAGDWCQGILKVREHVTIERWKWISPPTSATSVDIQNTSVKTEYPPSMVKHISPPSPSSSPRISGSGKWHRIVRIGSGILPCTFTFNAPPGQVNSPFEVGGLQWEFVENL